MNVHAAMFGGRRVIARKFIIMINGFVVVLIVMVVIMVRIHSDCMDGISRSVVMFMGMGRRGRNETVTCECKRKAKAHEAPGERHSFKLAANCCILLNKSP